MGRVAVILALLCAAVAVAVPVRADPPIVVEGDADPTTFYSGSLGRWPIGSVPGYVVRLSDINRSAPNQQACPSPASVIWRTFRDRLVYGDGIRSNAVDIAGNPLNVSLSYGLKHLHYSVSRWPVIPTATAGVFGEGDQACESATTSTVPFVAPAANTYKIDITIDRGSLVASMFRFYPRSLSNSGNAATPRTLLSSTAIRQYLPQGTYAVQLKPGAQGVTQWTVNVDDDPPQFMYLRVRAGASLVHVEFRMSESGRVDLDVLHGKTVVRRILTGKKVGVNNRSYAWDGHLASGKPVPPGRYTLRVSFVDWRGRKVVRAVPYTIAENNVGYMRTSPIEALALRRAMVITVNRHYAILGPYRAVDGSDDAYVLEHAFGKVSQCRGSRGTWKSVNLRAYFNFAGDTQSCPPAGQLDIVIVGAGWRTSRGLAVGDDLRRLSRLYPGASTPGPVAASGGYGWVDLRVPFVQIAPHVRFSCNAFTAEDAPCAQLAAKIRNKRVAAFAVRVGGPLAD